MNVIPALQALANTNRLKILHLLKKGPHSTTQIAHSIGISRPAVSQHMGVLHRAGLVTYRVDGQKPQYSINPQGFVKTRLYIETYERLKK